MRSRFVALVVAGLLAVGMLGAIASAPGAAAAPPPAPSYQPPPVAFGPCTDPRLLAAGAQCGTVVVPLDYANPAGATIRLAISRVRHKTPDAQYQGVVLVNPGGPGGSGLRLSTLQSRVPNGAGNSYDWIGFDPRGVGASTPTLSCQKDYAGYDRPYYVAPGSPRDEAAWLSRSTRYAAECAVAGHDLLGHLRTTDSARDIDSIRKALGEQQINYYGFSYGTYLGSVYATLFPQQVRRMVFDGIVDPTRVWERANEDQDVAFEKSITVFFSWVARYDDTYHLGTTEAAVERQYYAQYQRLRTAPAGGRIGSSEWNDIFLQAGYYVFGWEDIASAFSAWVNRGDPSGLLTLYPPPTDDNGYAIYLGVQCTDAPWSRYPQFRQRTAALYPKARFQAWGNAWFNAPCTFWPARSGTPTAVDGGRVPPVLLVNETLDAATPYSGALTTRRLFPRSALVEGVGGTTHAGTLQGAAPCEDRLVANYLATGALPARRAGNASDAQCAPVPQPVPAPALVPAPLAAVAKPAAAAVTSLAPQRWPG